MQGEADGDDGMDEKNLSRRERMMGKIIRQQLEEFEDEKQSR